MNAHRSVASPAVPVYNGRGQVVGDIKGDGRPWLYKYGLDPTIHMLRKPPGWATDAAHIDELRRLGGAGIRLKMRSGETLQATLAVIDKHGFPFDRGHSRQIVLPLKFWGTKGADGAAVPKQGPPKSDPPRQAEMELVLANER